MKDNIEVTPEMAIERLTLDAQKICEVAEIMKMNADALVSIMLEQSSKPPSEKLALGVLKIVHGALLQMAEDMLETVELTKKGELMAVAIPLEAMHNAPDAQH